VTLLSVRNVTHTYGAPGGALAALREVSLDIDRGAFAAIVGPSGCGKSTLLHLCGGMDRPTTGAIALDGQRLDLLGEEALARVRRDRIGFVFQAFNLLPTLTTLENIALPLLLAGTPLRTAEERAALIADRVGLAHRRRHYPAQLSGGEMQRAAIARAVVHEPELIIADEPTGNLDSENGAAVLALLRALNRDSKVTILLATHAGDLASAAGQIIHLRDGRIVGIDRTRVPA
jgi:putative ABC transport system ATP-binding protein